MKSIKLLLSMTVLGMAACTLLTGCVEQAQPPVVIPDDAPLGNGDWNNPLQAWQAHLGTTNGDREVNWVTGYIVGWINTDLGSAMTERSCVFGPPCNVNTNLVIAQYPYDPATWAELGYTWKNCVSVQLPSGDVRSALNLADHPENFNRQVTIKGTTGVKYCSVYGVKFTESYNWGDEGIYEEPAVEATFVKATEIKSGHKYAFVRGSQVGIPIIPSYSYGYIYMVDYKSTGADSFTTSEDNAFLFEAEGEGFTIRDCYDRYYYLESAYTSFQVSATKPAANYTWKVVFDTDHFNITNIGRPNTIDWIPTHSNFSTVATSEYTNGGPMLYEMQETE